MNEYDQCEAKECAPDRAYGIVDELDQAVASLERQIENAWVRLGPIIPPFTLETASKGVEPQAAVSDARGCLNRVHTATSSLVSLLERIEV